VSSTVYKVLGVVVAVAIAAWWLHDKLRDSKINTVREKQRSQQQQRATDAVKTAVARHGAIVGWEERFAKNVSEPLSIQLDDALVQTGGKPILVEGFVEDVSRRGETYLINITDWHVGGASVHFVLECDAATARRLTSKWSGFLEISAVAKIVSVDKGIIAIKSGVKRTDDEAPVEIDSSSLFIAHGQCLEVVTDNSQD